jgi:hypothetical protein
MPWTMSIGPWTEGDGAGPRSMVDRALYPFGGSNLGRPSGFQWSRVDGDELMAIVDGAARACGGQVTNEVPEGSSGGHRLTAKGLGGRGDDSEARGGISEA